MKNSFFTLISKNRINNARICHGNGPYFNADNENVNLSGKQKPPEIGRFYAEIRNV